MRQFKLFTAAVGMAFALSVLPGSAQTQLKEAVRKHFADVLAERMQTAGQGRADSVRSNASAPALRPAGGTRHVAALRRMVWEAWCEANRSLNEQKLVTPRPLGDDARGAWELPERLEPHAVMPYFYGAKGTAQGRRPLFLYLHGSGPKEQEWQTGLRLAKSFRDAPSLYFIPQIPNEGGYYRWWQKAKLFAWEQLLRQALAGGDVDADRLYLFGISEGGYGSQRLASFYADYWAAAGPMAGGEPLKNAPVENCANIGFSLLTGADDTGFYRNILTHYTQAAFDSAQLAHPLSADGRPLFRHRISLLPGMQHHIDYSLTTPWLAGFVRNPCPRTVLWEDFPLDGRRRSGFYNLQVLRLPSPGRTFYAMTITGNVVSIDISNVAYTVLERDPRWGIEMRFSRTYSRASGGRLRIYLDDRLVDMSRPVSVVVNGSRVFRGRVRPSLEAMTASCEEYFDPCRVFAASVDVAY